MAKHLAVPEIWHKSKRVLRTAVQVIVSGALVLGTIVVLAPQVLDAVAEVLPGPWVAWLTGAIAARGRQCRPVPSDGDPRGERVAGAARPGFGAEVVCRGEVGGASAGSLPVLAGKWACGESDVLSAAGGSDH
jgi:hypothetical protein